MRVAFGLSILFAFCLGAAAHAAAPSVYLEELSWTELRDRWEYSHVIRAGFAFVSFLAMIITLLLKSQG